MYSYGTQTPGWAGERSLGTSKEYQIKAHRAGTLYQCTQPVSHGTPNRVLKYRGTRHVLNEFEIC
eukprot:scaffold167657_cov48-Prasinocladus_malaysianus.AAC.3